MRFNPHLDSNFTERFAFGLQFQERWKQDLFWLISSELISKNFLSNFHFEWPKSKQLEELFNSINEMDIPKNNLKKRPLGKYAEVLLKHYFENSSEIKLIANNIQIIENQVTQGELDFIIEIDKQLIHLEVALKFYIAVEVDGTFEYIGPNAKDTWEKKRKKLVEKQIPIDKYLLESMFNYEAKTDIQNKCWVFGELFKLTKESTQLQKHWAVKKANISLLKEAGSYFKVISQKEDWIFPFNQSKDIIPIDKILALNGNEINTIQVVIYNQKKIPISRGFILNNNWPSTIN